MSEQPTTPTNRTNTGLVIGLVVAVVVIVALVFMLLSQRGDDGQPEATTPVAPVATATSTPDVVETVAPTATPEAVATVAPVAVIVAPTDGSVGEALFFSAANSTSGQTIVSYAWNFGDGTTADAVEIEKSYGAAGVYLVNLAVGDQQGLVAEARHQISIAEASSEQMPVDAVGQLQIADELINVTVDGQPASVSIVSGIPSFDAKVGQVVRLDGTPAANAFQGLELTWTMGDGLTPVTGTVVEHSYAATGVYEIAIAATTGELTGSRLYQVSVSE